MESAIFLCALLRGIAESYTAKNPSFICVFDLGVDLLGIEIDKKASQVLPDPADARLSPAWFDAWVSQENLGDPDNLMATLFPPLARALKKQVTLGALRASSQKPYRYDCFFWTDGKCIYHWPRDKLVPNADPKTFRRVTPANTMDSAFYADARQVWYYSMGVVGLVPVQSLEAGVSMQGWRPFSSDGEPLLRCGDTVWTIADVDYPNGGKNTKGNVKSALHLIQSQGGIPAWEKTYNFEYLRPTQVEGASFTQVKDMVFEDSQSVYVQTGQGLIRIEGAIPGMTRFLGDLSCNNGRIFRYGYEVQCRADTTSLRYIGCNFYADNRDVFLLRGDTVANHHYCPILHILQDANPANFRLMLAVQDTSLSGDEQHVWLNGELLPGLSPDAVKFMGSYFWTDGKRVYFCENPVPDADPKKFEVLHCSRAVRGSDYARQETTVYFRGSQIPDADAASFVADSTITAHDRYRDYNFGEVVEQ